MEGNININFFKLPELAQSALLTNVCKKTLLISGKSELAKSIRTARMVKKTIQIVVDSSVAMHELAYCKTDLRNSILDALDIGQESTDFPLQILYRSGGEFEL